MGREDKTTWKANYFTKIARLFDDYSRCFIVNIDNVGSKQMQQIRSAMRGQAVLLNGKNTMMRKAIRGFIDRNPNLEKILPHIKANIGFVFTDDELTIVRDKILENRVPASARAGAIAPCDVKIPPQNTGLGPEKTSFFQALQIPTKIAKGTIEILTEVHLIEAGSKVGASEATLLNMLKISPFTYGLVIEQVYDNGSVYSPEVLDISSEKLMESIQQGATQLAQLSLMIGYPTVASVPHSIANGFKKLCSLCAADDELSFEQASTLLECLRDPEKLAAMTAASSAAPAASADAGGAAKEAAKEEEPEEESDDDMGFGLFDQVKKERQSQGNDS